MSTKKAPVAPTSAAAARPYRNRYRSIQRGKLPAAQNISTRRRCEELADSIRSQGIVQPMVVRPESANHYELVAGERRWRAAQLAGLQNPGGDPRGRRPVGGGDGADREYPARGPQSARGGAMPCTA